MTPSRRRQLWQYDGAHCYSGAIALDCAQFAAREFTGENMNKFAQCIAAAGFVVAMVSAQAQTPTSTSTSTAAEQPQYAELQHRSEKYHISYRINADGTHTEIRESSTKIIDKRAIEYLKRGYVDWSTSVETGEVLEAYTKKADGRRIDVAKDNFQLDVSKGRGADSPLYSDQTSMTVLFPDVAEGDTVTLKTKISSKEAMFPGYFSASNVFADTAAHDDVRIIFDAPKELPIRFSVNGLQEERSTTPDGRVLTTFRYQNPKPRRSERRNHSVYEIEDSIGVHASSFATYRQLAQAYGVRATPKASPTARIEALAKEIVGARTIRASRLKRYTNG